MPSTPTSAVAIWPISMMPRRALRYSIVTTCLATYATAGFPNAPGFDEGQWLKFMIALKERRLIVFVKDEKSSFYTLARDITLPEGFPDEGFVGFQQEEKGNAKGTMFDNLRIWAIDATFDIDAFASTKKRRNAPRLGSPQLREVFSNGRMENLVPVEGQWGTAQDDLVCNNVTAGWPRIRSKDRYGDVFIQFDLFRVPRSVTNWAGIALRTNEQCEGGRGIRIAVQNAPSGPRLLVSPVEDAALKREIEAYTRAMEEEARRLTEELEGLKHRWQGILAKNLDGMARVGDNLQIGDVRWRVLAAKDLGNRLPKLFGGSKTTPGRFIGVAIEVENLGNDPLTVLDRYLYDKDGRRYLSDPDVTWKFEGATILILDNLNPGVPYRFVQVHEVPKDASDFVVLVSNLRLFGRLEGAITIGH